MRGLPARPTVILIVATMIVGHLAFLLFPSIFTAWHWRAIDRLFLLRSSSATFRPEYDPTIVHVDIDNTTVATLGFNLTRGDFARAVDTLRAAGVAAQAWDFVFVSPAGDEDDVRFIRAVARAGTVYFGAALTSPVLATRRIVAPEKDLLEYAWPITVEGRIDDVAGATGALSTFATLAAASRGLGFLNSTSDPDGVYRRIPLVMRVGEKFYPSLALRVICDYLSVGPAQVILRPRSTVTLRRPQLRGTTMADIVIPLGRDNTMLINFVGSPDHMVHYSFATLLNIGPDSDQLDDLRTELAGRIALVADTATGTSDVGVTPVERRFPLVGLHANVMNSILTRSFVREALWYETAAAELAMAAAFIAFGMRNSPRWLLIGAGGLGLVYLVAASAAFLFGSIIFNIVRPVFVVAGACVAASGYRYMQEQRERLIVRRSFEAYFPPAVVEKVVRDPDRISAHGEKKELTVLFSDIQGFTTRCLTMTAPEVQSFLNEYFSRMVDIVFRHGGTVDKFIGDGLMVFFGDPEEQADHAVRAVRAAIDMQREIAAWNETLGTAAIKVRIGINTGPVMVGNMGSARRLSYTVLGSAVNLAQRLESSAPVGGILIAERTQEMVAAIVPTRARGEIQVKGVAEPVRVFEVPTQ